MKNISNLAETYLKSLNNIPENMVEIVKNAYIAGYNQQEIEDSFDNDIQDDEEDVFADCIDDITPIDLTDGE
jgi:hypothetical protein